MFARSLSLRHVGGLIVLSLCLAENPLCAQNSRAFVSTLGNDANSCDRSTPCRSFSGAIAKVAAGGEIIVLDAGNYSPVTITKSVSILADNHYVGIRPSSGGEAIIINVGNNDSVFLRGLTLNGGGTASYGLHVNGGSVVVEDCLIQAFNTAGVYANGPAKLLMKDSIIKDNNLNGGKGLLISASVVLDGVSVFNNGDGIYINSGSVVIKGGEISGNRSYGIISSGTIVSVAGSIVSHNDIGVRVSGGTIQLSDTLITANGTGVSTGGGIMGSYRNNQIFGNGTDGRPGSTITPF